LSTYVFSVFGHLPVQSIDTGLVMQVLEPIWATKTETASRIRGRVEAILDWAAARKFREGENPARWKGHLENLLPKRTSVRKVKHHAALPYDQIGCFMAFLRKQEGVSARGLEFLILTAARTSEVIGAKWSEVNFDDAVWVIPGDRIKGGKDHRVPLTAASLSVLSEMKSIAQSEFVFPGWKRNRPLSNMAFLQLLKRMERSDLTVHGFRSSFRDWTSERTNFLREVAEMALAHTIPDKVEAAYRRGDLFDKRRKLMGAWAEFCAVEQPATGLAVNVVSIG